MKPGYWPDVARMQKTIKDAGYTPIPENVDLVVTGKVVRQGAELSIELDKARQAATLTVTAARDDPDTAAHLERHIGETVEVEGRWQPTPPGTTGQGKLAVTAIYGVEDKRSKRG